MKPWPNSSAKRDHYKSYAWFINKILSLSSEKIPTSFHKHLCFSVYDHTVLEGADMDSPLKPDIVGCHRKLRNDERVLWKDVEVFVEVKSRWPEMISQASTYTRCCLAFQQNRDFITAIHVNHMCQEMRLGVYGRFGLIATKACILSTQDGFIDFVKAIVGIYSLNSARSAGIDASRTNTQFRLPHGKLYSIGNGLCNRRCVRGHAMRVYTVDIDEDQMQLADPKPLATPEFAPLSKHARCHRYPIQSLQHRCSPHPTDALTSLTPHFCILCLRQRSRIPSLQVLNLQCS
ncbi:hypothetical protein K439DRAFT_565395 [Ramaria rubella]|nr:hypothetical protein K439DRAFT_565395 [Ramaria rubella]